MTDSEMSMDEVLSSIRQMLTNEVAKDQMSSDSPVEDIEEIFILTPEMRCDTPESLKQRMQRVLDKMAHQEQTNKRQQTIAQELHPLLKEWMIQMRPDLDEEQIQTEVHKILPNL